MSITEDQLERWAQAPSETEQTRCQNAVARVTDILTSKFGSDVDIFLQGSYKNRTNVRVDSDVDIVVRHNSYYFPGITLLSPADKQIFQQGFVPSDYTFEQFKTEVKQELERAFGHDTVSSKSKCIRVEGNSYRVNADVVPCFVHNRMETPTNIAAKGIELRTDEGIQVISFPEQHFYNGQQKNQNTQEMYKPIVRILKNIRGQLIDQDLLTPDTMSSYFLECMVWNVLPHTHFTKNTYREATSAILNTLYSDMVDVERANDYAEVCDLLWLFRGSANRRPDQAAAFAARAHSLL